MKTIPKIAMLGICGLFTISCEEQATNTKAEEEQFVVRDKPLIRVIRFTGTDSDYGVELNGKQGFLRQEKGQNKRIEVPFDKASSLIEEFYAIPKIKDYLGDYSDNRQSSIHYLVTVYDEAPERYSEEYVDYVIPKNSVVSGTSLHIWFKKMEALRDTSQ